MKTMKNKIKNNSKRILAMFLTLCVFLAMFTGCTVSDDCCDDCGGHYIVFAEELPTDSRTNLSCTDPDCEDCDVETIEVTYVDCPDCFNGGEYVTTTTDCTSCVDGYVTIIANITCPECTGSGEVEYEGEDCGYCFGSGTIWSTCTVCGGDMVTDDDRICNNCTSGTMATTCTHCEGTGENSSSMGSCLDCGGDGVKTVETTTACTVSNCVDGEISSSVWVTCSTCAGYGGWTEEAGEGCEECDYLGLVDCPECDGYGYYDFGGVNYTCSYCGGTDQRVDSSGSVTGSGKIPCSYCSENEYYDVTYINSYGAECTVYVESGSVIPEYPALSLYAGKTADDYYLSSDEDGNTIVSKSAIVTSDRTLYVHFYVEDEYTVECYELTYNSLGSYYYKEDSKVFPGGSTLTAYTADDYYDAVVNWFADPYVCIGWYVSTSDLELGYNLKSYVNYFDEDDVCDLSEYTVTSDLYLYAVYSKEITADEDSSSDSNYGVSEFFDDISSTVSGWFDGDSTASTILNVVIIACAIVIGLLLLYLVFKVLITLFSK